MIFKRFQNKELAINTYLVGDENTKECVVMDPVRTIDEILQEINNEGLTLIAILETHVHADFVSGSRELKAAFSNKPAVYCSVMGGEKWFPKYADQPVRDGDTISLGKIMLKALHTPGHTPEHLAWLCYEGASNPKLIFTGDLLFVGAVGRPDLLGPEEFSFLAKDLYHSLFNTLAPFSDEVEIFPGHGAGSFCGKSIGSKPSSTLGNERQFNSSLQKKDLSAWIENLTKDMPASPMAYSKIKEINLGEPKLMRELFKSEQRITPREFLMKLFIDVRSPEAFAAKHLKNSINIPLKGAFSSWLEMVLLPEHVFSLIISSEDTLEPIKKMLAVAGLERLEGYILWEDLISASSSLVTSFPLISPGHFQKRMVLDVRTPAEWRTGHIEGARHIELARLLRSLNEIPRDTPIAAVCGSGYRASIAASLLRRAGFNDVANIQGGMQAWRDAKLPLIK